MHILAEELNSDTIRGVVQRLPPDVREWVASKVVFVWPPRGDSSSFVFSLDAAAVGDLQFICVHPDVAGCPFAAQRAIVVSEIARVIVNPAEKTEEPRWGPTSMSLPVNAKIQQLVSSWELWKKEKA